MIPWLGTVLLRRLRAQHLETLYADLLARGRRDGTGGLNAKTVLEVQVVIRKALADAGRKGLVVRNVADDAEAPKRQRPSNQLRLIASTGFGSTCPPAGNASSRVPSSSFRVSRTEEIAGQSEFFRVG